MPRPIAAINMALLTEGAGTEWRKLQTMNRGVNENAALKPETILADNHNPPNTVRRPRQYSSGNRSMIESNSRMEPSGAKGV